MSDVAHMQQSTLTRKGRERCQSRCPASDERKVREATAAYPPPECASLRSHPTLRERPRSGPCASPRDNRSSVHRGRRRSSGGSHRPRIPAQNRGIGKSHRVASSVRRTSRSSAVPMSISAAIFRRMTGNNCQLVSRAIGCPTARRSPPPVQPPCCRRPWPEDTVRPGAHPGTCTSPCRVGGRCRADDIPAIRASPRYSRHSRAVR